MVMPSSHPSSTPTPRAALPIPITREGPANPTTRLMVLLLTAAFGQVKFAPKRDQPTHQHLAGDQGRDQAREKDEHGDTNRHASLLFGNVWDARAGR